MEKREAFNYLIVGTILLVLVSTLFFLKGDITGYTIFQDSGTSFDNGTYANTTHDGSAVVLVGTNLTGSYTSEIFNALARISLTSLIKSFIVSVTSSIFLFNFKVNTCLVRLLILLKSCFTSRISYV